MTNKISRALMGAAAGLCLVAGSAAARPFTIEDYLRREAVSQVFVAPGGRWLVAEMFGPRLEAGRYDYDSLSELFRVRIGVVDLAHPGALRPLFPQESGVGYRTGPISPDGRRIAVFRLKDDQWTLGVAELATGEVRWLDVRPTLHEEIRNVDWISANQLVAIARERHTPPPWIQYMRPHLELPARWRATAEGGASVTVVGTGRYAGDSYAPEPKFLARIDARTGDVAVLQRGDFWDLEVSPSGRHVAVLERGELIRFQADQQMNGEMGVAMNRRRLLVVDTATGQASRPCPRCDVMGALLTWSPKGERLLVHARDDGQRWSDGRLLVITADRPEASAAPIVGFRPYILGRPEGIRAAWWGEVPVVFGRTSSGSRDDWHRLEPKGPVRLTSAFKEPPAEVVVASATRLLAEADGRFWSIDPSGRVRLQPAKQSLPPHPGNWDFHNRFVQHDGGSVILGSATPSGVRWRLAAGQTPPVDGAASDELLAADPASGGVAVLAKGPGAVRDLVWRAPGRPAVRLARLNAGMADIDDLTLVRIHHPGPGGEPRGSWLVLPPRPPGSPPPPLIVWPYPGLLQASAPPFADPAFDLENRCPQLLAHHGYAVLLPSLPSVPDGPGPGVGLADQVLAIVDAAVRQPDAAGTFDPDRLGLAGLSQGGYAVNAIVTQTNRFKAAVSFTGSSSWSSMWGLLSTHDWIAPEEYGPEVSSVSGWVESSQGEMHAPPWAAIDRYVANSPLFHAGAVSTPLLLMKGDQDFQLPAEDQRMFSAYARQGKDAELVTYWGETHVMFSPGNLRDSAARMFDWLDRALKHSAALVQ